LQPVTTHLMARASARGSILDVFGREPLGGEAPGLAGVASIETSYGDGWRGAGVGSNNMGAIQCGGSWKGTRFSYVDTHPNADGTSTRYQIDFRKYSTAREGWRDLGLVVYVNRNRASVRAAAIVSDWRGMSQWLHTTGYYEGFGKTIADRITNHYRSLSRAIARADGAVALPVVPITSLPHTVRRGDGTRGTPGEAVRLLQRELQLAADGLFGRVTENTLRVWQAGHGLVPDGVCGPKTWEALFSDDYTPGAVAS
jgi:hypothetical protein